MWIDAISLASRVVVDLLSRMHVSQHISLIELDVVLKSSLPGFTIVVMQLKTDLACVHCWISDTLSFKVRVRTKVVNKMLIRHRLSMLKVDCRIWAASWCSICQVSCKLSWWIYQSALTVAWCSLEVAMLTKQFNMGFCYKIEIDVRFLGFKLSKFIYNFLKYRKTVNKKRLLLSCKLLDKAFVFSLTNLI